MFVWEDAEEVEKPYVMINNQKVYVHDGEYEGDTPLTAEHLNEAQRILKEEIINLVYPVGAIYMGVNNVNPSVFLGGTWEVWGSGRVPVGVNSNDTSFNTVEKTGGEKTHILTTSEMPNHTHNFTGTSHKHTYNKSNSNTGSTALTIAQIPSHDHSGNDSKYWKLGTENPTGARGQAGIASGAGNLWQWSDKVAPQGGGQGHTHTIGTTSNNTGETTAGGTNSSTGGGNAHNNLQPYITCYMWKRTA